MHSRPSLLLALLYRSGMGAAVLQQHRQRKTTLQAWRHQALYIDWLAGKLWERMQHRLATAHGCHILACLRSLC